MRYSGERGLTLLELLVALALLSLIGLGLTSTIGTSKRVWEQSERYSTTLEEINTRQLLKRVLERAIIEDLDKNVGRFTGTQNTLDFKSNYTLTRSSPLNILDVTLNNSAHGMVLDIRETSSEGNEVGLYSRILRSKIASISYFDGRAGEWYDVWQKTGLPRLVYFQFDDPKWPDLAIHLTNS